MIYLGLLLLMSLLAAFAPGVGWVRLCFPSDPVFVPAVPVVEDVPMFLFDHGGLV